MNPRYLVKYRTIHGGEPEVREHAFGRFHDLESAENKAKASYDVEGYGEVISVRVESSTERRIYSFGRVIIRSIRVLIGALLAIAAYAWFSAHDPSIGDIPLGQLTLKVIVSSLFNIALVAGAAWLSWLIAFGDGPDD